MFVCAKCLEKNYTNEPSFARSFGPCEDCGITRECNDIPCSYLELKSEAKKERKKS